MYRENCLRVTERPIGLGKLSECIAIDVHCGSGEELATLPRALLTPSLRTDTPKHCASNPYSNQERMHRGASGSSPSASGSGVAQSSMTEPSENPEWPGTTADVGEMMVDRAVTRNAFVKFMMQKMQEVGVVTEMHACEDTTDIPSEHWQDSHAQPWPMGVSPQYRDIFNCAGRLCGRPGIHKGRTLRCASGWGLQTPRRRRGLSQPLGQSDRGGCWCHCGCCLGSWVSLRLGRPACRSMGWLRLKMECPGAGSPAIAGVIWSQ